MIHFISVVTVNFAFVTGVRLRKVMVAACCLQVHLGKSTSVLIVRLYILLTNPCPDVVASERLK